MKLIINLLISTIAVVAASYVLPGVHVSSVSTAFIVAILLGAVNTFLKPILILLTLPITIVTLGLFALVINALLVLFVSNIVPGFRVEGFLAALIFSLVLSLLTWFLNSLTT